MYKKIMVPVDLEHADKLEKALKVSADLSKHYGAPVVYVGITTETPNAIAHNPEEYAKKLEAFAQEQADSQGYQAVSKAYATPDPAVDLNKALVSAIDELGADLVVMASHVPNFADQLFQSHGGNVVTHTDISVFVVR